MKFIITLMLLISNSNFTSSQRSDYNENYMTDATTVQLSKEYFSFKKITIFVMIACINKKDYKQLSKLMQSGTSMISIYDPQHMLLLSEIDKKKTVLQLLSTDKSKLGVMLDTRCSGSEHIINEASNLEVFNSSFSWLITDFGSRDDNFGIFETFALTNLTIDSEITVALLNVNDYEDEIYMLFDIYNVYYILDGKFKITSIGEWNKQTGFNISFEQKKFIKRKDFNGIRLRASIVMAYTTQDKIQNVIDEESFTTDINAMTKQNAKLLQLLSAIYNFRIHFMIDKVWGGTSADGRQEGMMGDFQQRHTDVGVGIRFLPDRMAFAHFVYQTWKLTANFFFRDIEEDIGPLQSKFIEPLSHSSWLGCIAIGIIMCFTLIAASMYQKKQNYFLEEETGFSYAVLNVIAAFCQQVFEVGPSPWKRNGSKIKHYDNNDAVQEPRLLSIRITYLVIFMCSLLVFNYYTSSIVSSLLSPPTKADVELEDLVSGSLTLIFEDIGYTRSLFENPSFSFKQHLIHLEKQMVAKVRREAAKYNRPIYERPETGIELIRKGGYAYQTEAETASYFISNTFNSVEVCDLRTYTMLECYIFMIVQKNSPFSEAFRIGLLKLEETGLVQRWKNRFLNSIPECDNRRTLPAVLGRTAPVLIVLSVAGGVGVIILLIEILYERYKKKRN